MGDRGTHKDGGTAYMFGKSGPMMASGDKLKTQAKYLKRCMTHQEDGWKDHYISMVTDKSRMEVVEIFIHDLEHNITYNEKDAEEMLLILKQLIKLREGDEDKIEAVPLMTRLFRLRLSPEALRGARVAQEIAEWREGDHEETAKLAFDLMEKWKDTLRLSNKQMDARHMRNIATQLEKDLYNNSMIGSGKFNTTGVKPEMKYNKTLNNVRRLIRDPRKVKALLEKKIQGKDLVNSAAKLPGASSSSSH